MANLLSTTVSGSLSVNVDSSGSSISTVNNGNASRWYGRITTFNSTSDKSVFLGTYASVAVVGAHNNALTAWANLYVNNVDGVNGGNVYLPTNSYVANNSIVHTGGGQTIAGITYFSNGESLQVYGIRGRFTNEYIHLYNKVGIGNPSGWGQGEGNTPNQGLSTYGGIVVAYGNAATSQFQGHLRIDRNWGAGDYGAEQFTIRGTYPSIALRNTANNAKWLIHSPYSGTLQFYYGGTVDDNNWGNKFEIATNGNIWMEWGGWLSDLLNAKQNASTAITTSNIGSQSVSYASSAGSVAWGNVTSKPSYIMYYQGFTLDANTMDTNSTGFTYANNAPFYGPIARFSTGGGYDLWLGGSYIGGSSFYLRTRNGDNGTFNAWREIIHSGNIASQSVNYANSAGDSTNLGGLSSSRFPKQDYYYSSSYNWDTIEAADTTAAIVLRIESAVSNPPAGDVYNWSLWQQGTRSRGSQIAVSAYGTQRMYFRGSDFDSGSYRPWSEVIHSGNVGSYALTSIPSTISPNNIYIGNAIYFGGANNYLNWTNSRIYSNVGIQSASDILAPIFYDSQNTGYYGDFASTSVMNAIRLGTSTNSGTISGGGDWGIRFANDNGWIQFGPANNSWTHIYSDKNFYMNTHLWVSNGYKVTAWDYNNGGGVLYASAFYDANDTTYYLDPNGGGYLRGRVDVVGGHGNSSLRVALRSDENGAGTGIVTLQAWCSEPGNTWDGAGFGYNVDNNSNDNAPSYHFGRPNPNFGQAYMRMFSNGTWNFYNATSDGSSHSNTMTLTRDGVVIANNSMRAPIYYDSNDTTFYVDPNSSSRVRNLYVGDSGSNWSDPGGWGTQFHVSNGPHSIIRVYARNEGIETIMYSHIGGQSKVGSGTNHDFSIVRNFSDRMTFYSGYTYANGYLQAADSLRAPIFYDSNDTNYFIDPNGSSQISTIYANNWFRSQANTGLYFSSYSRGIWAADSAGASYGNVSIYGDGVNSWPGYAINNLAIFMARDIRRGIFIPSADSWLIRYEQSSGMAFVDFELQWGSDIRHKSNIKRLTNSLEKVKQLKGVSYNYKGNERTSIGFIAQEVEPILPEVVSTDADGFKSVGYANIVALLSEAIKEQQAMIEELKARIDVLESK